MFFYASKVIGYVIQPSTALMLLFVLGLAFYWRGRVRAGMRILAAAVALYALASLSPLPNAIILPLEEHYSRPAAASLDRVDGIIILGGVVDTIVSGARDEIALSEAAERLTEPMALARRFPSARIVISGGDGALIYKSGSEAEVASRFFTRMGFDPARIMLETRSRTTAENAAFTKKLLNPPAGERWLLVTSAFHMWRAMACFRAAGFDVTPWPVDYRTRGPEDLLRLPPRPSEAWRRIDLAAKEWMGLAAYWLTGRL